MAEMTLARVAMDRQVLEVLTPEQRKQVAEMKSEREAVRGDGQRAGEGGPRR
jgi:Spy/CpxP family protein refolding chaperone